MKENAIERDRSGHDVKKMIMLGLFVALSYASLFVCHFKLDFLSFEPKDAIIIISSFTYGPLAGVTVAVVTAIIEMLTISTTGLYGLLMNIASSAVLAAVAGVIYKHKRTMLGAVVSLAAAVASMTAAMTAANVLVTPFYMGAPRQAVIDMLVPMIIPFNVVKGIFSASIAMLLYKPFVTALRASGMMSGKNSGSRPSKTASIVVTAASVAVVAASLFYFFKVLGGNFDLK